VALHTPRGYIARSCGRAGKSENSNLAAGSAPVGQARLYGVADTDKTSLATIIIGKSRPDVFQQGREFLSGIATRYERLIQHHAHTCQTLPDCLRSIQIETALLLIRFAAYGRNLCRIVTPTMTG
jgi:hypothetical protein